MTTEELRKAAERCRRELVDSWADVPVKGPTYTELLAVLDDYLTEHPEDEDDWLLGHDTGSDSSLRDRDPALWNALRAAELILAVPFSEWVRKDHFLEYQLLVCFRTMAGLIRRDYPADDSEPLTADWLDSRSDCWCHGIWYTLGDSGGSHLYIEFHDSTAAGDVYVLRGSPDHNKVYITTRGQLRRLLSVFGVKTREGN